MIDRAYSDYSSGNRQIRIRRQRINGGINLALNPNDVFKTFSYFDFQIISGWKWDNRKLVRAFYNIPPIV